MFLHKMEAHQASHLFDFLRMGCSVEDLRLLLNMYAPHEAAVLNHTIAAHDDTCFSLALSRASAKKSPKRLAIVEMMLERGADPNYVFSSGITLLQLVVWRDDLAMVVRLLDCPDLFIDTTKALIYSRSTTNVMVYMFEVYRAYERTEDFGLAHVIAEIAQLPAPAQILKILSAEDRAILKHLAKDVLGTPAALRQVFRNRESSAQRIDEVARLVAGYLLWPVKKRSGFSRILRFL
jgi:hypothetical protein